MALSKDDFIALSKRLFSDYLGHKVKRIVETKFVSLEFFNDDDEKVKINGYRFEPFTDDPADVMSIKFHVSVNGEAPSDYDLIEIDDNEYGVTEGLYEDYKKQIDLLVSQFC